MSSGYTRCPKCGQNAVTHERALREEDNRVYDYTRCLCCGHIVMTAEPIEDKASTDPLIVAALQALVVEVREMNKHLAQLKHPLRVRGMD